MSDYLAFNTTINTPMTIAEIANQHEQTFERNQVQVVEFRREESLNGDFRELNSL